VAPNDEIERGVIGNLEHGNEHLGPRFLLRVDVTSRDVAELACAMAGPLFDKTTGAQVAVDGGNERVI